MATLPRLMVRPVITSTKYSRAAPDYRAAVKPTRKAIPTGLGGQLWSGLRYGPHRRTSSFEECTPQLSFGLPPRRWPRAARKLDRHTLRDPFILVDQSAKTVAAANRTVKSIRRAVNAGIGSAVWGGGRR
jgi:hypothetical protein